MSGASPPAAHIDRVRSYVRWYLKKAARKSFAIAGLAAGLGDAKAGHRGTLRVLTYHRFGDATRDPFCVSTEQFAQQVELLAEEGRAVSLDQMILFLEGRLDLPENSCLITIDDGMLSTLTEALPVLDRHSVPAIAFVSSNLVGRDVPGLPERYLTWDELKGLVASGLVKIGSHSHNHISLGSLPEDEASDELCLSRKMLVDCTGEAVDAFAYPFGMLKDFNPQTDIAAQEAGYTLAFNSMHGPIEPGMCPFSLPRVKVEGGESLELFNAITLGALDRWRVVDENLWRLQRFRRELNGQEL